MAEVASAFVSLMPSARGFGRTAERQVSGEMRTSGSRLGATMGRAMLLGAGAAIGVGIIGARFVKDALGEATEAAVVTARTSNVIEKMGNVAGITAKQVAGLAQSISNKVGIDDEAIQTGENMLLTFGKIRNETGKGNRIFTRATKLMTDYSTVMGTDAKSAAIQLGKALNDPVKGITALGRAGVQFSEDQKKAIEKMVESGDILGAQKLILGELTKQFGGAAEAMATPAEKAQVAWDNLKEQIGTALLPTFNKVATSLSEDIVPAISKFIRQMGNGNGAGGKFADIMGKVGSALHDAGDFLQNVWLPKLQEFWSWLNTNIIPGLKVFISRLGDGLRGAFENITAAIQDNRPQVEAFIEAVKRVGKWIGESVLPAMGAWADIYFPALGKAIGIGIRAMSILIDMTLALVVTGSRAFRLFLQTVMLTFGTIIRGAAEAFGWMPGIGPKVKAANEAFHSLGNQAIEDLRSIENEARAMGAALDAATRDRTVTITTVHNNAYGGLAGGGGHSVNDTGVAGKSIAPSGVAPRAVAGGGGEVAVFHLYDSSGVLMGSMRGVARGTVADHLELASMARRAGAKS